MGIFLAVFRLFYKGVPQKWKVFYLEAKDRWGSEVIHDLIIGTGESGQMQVLAETQDFVRACGIQLVFAPTEYAYKMYNDIYAKRRVIGAFHLEC